MNRFLRAALYAVSGYVTGVLLGVGLVYAVSSNTHDLSVEAPMTGVFVTGPLFFVIGGVWGALRRRP